MLRQAAFAGHHPLLKGNLHTHTTRSDGKVTPEEVIRTYYSTGYDFLALTDHRLYNYTNFAKDCALTILPGMEMDRGIEGRPGTHCFHTVSLGPEKENGNGFDQDQVFTSGKVKDQWEFQSVLDTLHENGNITLYCHPQWSGTPAREFENLQGNFAMEIWNSGCALENDMDTNAAYWDELLMQGKRIYGVAVDDCHKLNQLCLGWVMVHASNTIKGILSALQSGAYYSSCGPEIHDFYIDGNTAVLECSPCDHILFIYGGSPNKLFRNADSQITKAVFQVPDHYTYLRAGVMDSAGRRAWTNPIFIDEKGK